MREAHTKCITKQNFILWFLCGGRRKKPTPAVCTCSCSDLYWYTRSSFVLLPRSFPLWHEKMIRIAFPRIFP